MTSRTRIAPTYLNDTLGEHRYELSELQASKINSLVLAYETAPYLVRIELNAIRDGMRKQTIALTDKGAIRNGMHERITFMVKNIKGLYVDEELLNSLSKAATLECLTRSPSAMSRVIENSAAKSEKIQEVVQIWLGRHGNDNVWDAMGQFSYGKGEESIMRVKYMEIASQSYGEKLVLEALGITDVKRVDEILTEQHAKFTGSMARQPDGALDGGIISMSGLMRGIENPLHRLSYTDAHDGGHIM